MLNLLFPTIYFIFYFWQLTAMEYRTFDTFFLLITVIIQQTERIFAQKGDGY